MAQIRSNQILHDDIESLFNGTTATTQAAGSNDTKIATDAYVDSAFSTRYNKITVVAPIAGTTTSYTTLQAAFNAIPAATDNATARQVYTVYIPSGTYDEDVSIEINNRRIIVICQGSVGLGTLTGSSWGSGGTPRNLTITNNGTATINSIRSGIAFVSVNPNTDGLTTHQSYLSKFRVSGNLVLTAAIGISSEFYFEIEVFGNFDTSGYTGNCNVYTRNSRYRGTYGGSPTRLQYANRCVFDGLLTTNVYSEISDCAINSGMTVTSGTPDIQPSGILNTNFSGTFTGPAGSLRLDNNTNYWFIANGATLAGGATKVYLNALSSSTESGILSSTDWSTFNGKQDVLWDRSILGSNYYLTPHIATDGLFFDGSTNGPIVFTGGELISLQGQTGLVDMQGAGGKHTYLNFAVPTASSQTIRFPDGAGDVAVTGVQNGFTVPQTIFSTSPVSFATSHLILSGTETSGAANTGAGITFSGHNNVSPVNWAQILGVKENSTSGNSQSRMVFGTLSSTGTPIPSLYLLNDGTSLPTAFTNTFQANNFKLKSGASYNATLTSGTLTSDIALTGPIVSGTLALTSDISSALTAFEAAVHTWASQQTFLSVNSYNTVTGITAYAGGGQANATQLTAEFNNVTVCASSGDSVKLMLINIIGNKQIVKNNGAANLVVYPQVGGYINSQPINVGYTLYPGHTGTFVATAPYYWQVTDDITGLTNNWTGSNSFTNPLTVYDDLSLRSDGILKIESGVTGKFYNVGYTDFSLPADRACNIPNVGADSYFVMTEGAQTINGNKTLTGTTTFGTAGTNGTLNITDSSAVSQVYLSAAASATCWIGNTNSLILGIGTSSPHRHIEIAGTGSATPHVVLNNTGNTSNNKYWDTYVGATQLISGCVSDDWLSGFNWRVITRNGVTAADTTIAYPNGKTIFGQGTGYAQVNSIVTTGNYNLMLSNSNGGTDEKNWLMWAAYNKYLFLQTASDDLKSTENVIVFVRGTGTAMDSTSLMGGKIGINQISPAQTLTINGSLGVKSLGLSASYNPSALTTNTHLTYSAISSNYTYTVSTEDIQNSNTSLTRWQIVTDATNTGAAKDYPITIAVESGSLVGGDKISTRNGLAFIYTDGTYTYSYTLAQYGQTTHSSTFSGPWASASATKVCTLIKHGNVVTMTIPSVIAAYNSDAYITMTTVLPSGWRPAIETYRPIKTQNNSINTAGFATIGTDGSIKIFNNAQDDGFSTGGNCGFFNIDINWVI